MSLRGGGSSQKIYLNGRELDEHFLVLNKKNLEEIRKEILKKIKMEDGLGIFIYLDNFELN